MFQSLLLAALIFFPICNSTYTITPIQSLRVGETIISAGENFVLGFFSPGNSKNRYVGISYDKTLDQSVVWTTNRENPVGNSSGVLTIIGGNLVLIDGGQNNNIDSGDLVLIDDHGVIFWESFDYPTNTHLPRMKMGLSLRTGLNTHSVSIL